MSLFGGQPANTAAPAAGTAAAKPLFGSLGTSTFGNLGGGASNALNNTAQPSTAGIGGFAFAKPAATTAATGTAQSQAGAFSLFASTAQPAQTNTQSAPSGGLFSNTATAQTNAPPQSSVLQASTQQQQQSGGLQQSAGDNRSARFDHLLEKGRKRAGENGLSSLEELPSLQLNLGDIARKVRNLGAGGPSAAQAQDDRAAHYLLSASGVKIGSTIRDLNQFSTQAGISTGPTANVLDTDVDSYLSNIHSQSTLALIQEGLEQSKRDFDAFLEENVQIEWDAQRKRIYEHFGLGRQSEELAASQSTFNNTGRGAFGRTARKGRSMGPKASQNGSFAASNGPVIGSFSKGRMDPSDKSTIGGQVGPEDRFVRDKQERFMERVQELNKARQRETPYPVLHEFASVEDQSMGENTEHFCNAYSALISITGEKQELQDLSNSAPKTRQFAREYLDEHPNSANTLSTRKRILNGSRKFLESKFTSEVDNAIRKHPREAQVGGIPSAISRIRGYIRVKLAFKELGQEVEQFQRIGAEGEEFPWVIIFYLLRGGLVQEAAEYVREKKTFFQNNDRNFAAAILHYAQDADRRLTPDLQQRINNAYAQRSRIGPSNDPYRMACYKLIGRCEMTRKNLEPLSQSLDDWVWLQFNLAREGNRAEENAGEMFGLEELQDTIKDIGERHFGSGSSESAGSYGVYFYLATLAGMFESAVNYLYKYNYVSAVHFAIALDYYGLLRVSDWTTAGMETLTYTTQQKAQLNFGRIVGVYTADFRAARADAAAEYLILICLNADLDGEAGRQQAALCHEALRELVLETREFATLLGDVKANGESTQGLIQQRLALIKLSDDDAFIRNITQESAKTADDNGRTNDAVLLSHLAGEYDAVTKILNRALSEALSVEIGQEPLRLEPLKQRMSAADAQAQAQAPVSDMSSSLSMLGTDDPLELAQRVMDLYNRNALWWGQVSQMSRDTLGILFQLNTAKKIIEARRYMEALDKIEAIGILPLQAQGNLSSIRASANNFAIYPPEVARNIGNVLLWCIGCCSRHREVLLSGQFDDPTRRALAAQLLQKAKDLMVFAGLIRYKLPPRVFETLAKEGQEVGAY
ncbi:nuclear pore protein-like protein [Aaosphaeria arxii CBS 175.79]|uniref:Nuclear pore protein-like protein n=1 Tax=Aaosphaeria arxii CBS 175.79 TaxID=1450172 RepID=A0A6A5Y2X3_9PLEO|nr:nuclear pore protein-like protein [Aaosphaeria arxii CBS 175.79]KAF2019583.1 nuclear pore protein-like protein [Aaosphaeria arxii CBS 175.79]